MQTNRWHVALLCPAIFSDEIGWQVACWSWDLVDTKCNSCHQPRESLTHDHPF